MNSGEPCAQAAPVGHELECISFTCRRPFPYGVGGGSRVKTCFQPAEQAELVVSRCGIVVQTLEDNQPTGVGEMAANHHLPA